MRVLPCGLLKCCLPCHAWATESTDSWLSVLPNLFKHVMHKHLFQPSLDCLALPNLFLKTVSHESSVFPKRWVTRPNSTNPVKIWVLSPYPLHALFNYFGEGSLILEFQISYRRVCVIRLCVKLYLLVFWYSRTRILDITFCAEILWIMVLQGPEFATIVNSVTSKRVAA